MWFFVIRDANFTVECGAESKSTTAFVNLNDYRLSCVRCRTLYAIRSSKLSIYSEYALTHAFVRFVRNRTPSHAASMYPHRQCSLVCCFASRYVVRFDVKFFGKHAILCLHVGSLCVQFTCGSLLYYSSNY